MSFERALTMILKHEGGYSDNPADRGGPTKQGVTQRVYDTWRMTGGKPVRSVRGIDGSEVSAIYLQNYWIPANCDLLPDNLALVHFDSAVNHGVKRAIKFLQLATGANPDGVFGPATQAAITTTMGKLSEHIVIGLYLAEREDFYDEIVARDPTQSLFLRGWKNRIASLRVETSTG